MKYNEHEELSAETLKLLDKVCEGIEVPSDEESLEAAIAHNEVIVRPQDNRRNRIL